ncbi:MAG: DegV family protein [Ruminococcus sp.]|nr:DegV family protein [Ruminococcus sp.]
MTDTNSGITPEQADKRGIYLIPMPVLINNKTFFEGVDLTHEQLYSQMRADADISTSQPSVGTLLEMWESVLSTYDQLVYIPMSSGLSGSYATAKAMSSDYNGRVEVADTHRISVTMKDCVYDAVSLASKGKTAVQIVKTLEENAYHSVVYLGVDTLKYLKKSGRVTASAATVASILNIKPILKTEGEKFDTFAKVRGLYACKERIIEATRNELSCRFRDIPRENLRIATAGTFEGQSEADAWKQQVQEAFADFDVIYDPLSCSIACHTGIGAVGIGISKILYSEVTK